jgi:hypothetical protein
MRQVRLSRKEFLEWMSNQEVVPSVSGIKQRDTAGDIKLVWLEGEIQKPVISVPSGDMREFLAFVATYLSSYLPFTAFYRVVPDEMLHVLVGQTSTFSPVRDFAIGAMIGEAVSQMPTRMNRLSEVPIQACLATGSSVASQALAAGYEPSVVNIALNRWGTVRERYNNYNDNAVHESIQSFWRIILNSIYAGSEFATSRDDRYLVEFCRKIISSGGDVAEIDLISFLPERSDPYKIYGSLKASLEVRVQSLINLSTSPTLSRISPAHRDALLGFVAAQIGEGSLNYIPLLQELSGSASFSVFWYCAFAALKNGSEVLSAGDGLGRRLSRSMEANGLDHITADIGYEEFLLTIEQKSSSTFRTELQSVVQVELLPRVVGRFRQSREVRQTEELTRMKHAIGDARHLANQLTVILNSASHYVEPQQGVLSDLFRGKTTAPKEGGRRKK